jgi:hypothetical protein
LQLNDKLLRFKERQSCGQRELIAALEAQALAGKGLETPDDFAFEIYILYNVV